MLSLFIVLALVAVAKCEVSSKELLAEEWESFKLEYKKNYGSLDEEKYRMKTFMENRNKIAKHNQRYEKGLISYKLGLNKFADIMPQEFVSIMNGYNRSVISVGREERLTFMSPANVVLPKAVDWRKKGAVTHVKDQGQCGSCWAFSTTGSLEAQHFRKNGVLVSLSEQNLVDCSTKYGNGGCNGGLMDIAFKYIKENGGIDTEKSYPYEGFDDKCHFKKSTVGATDKGFVDIPEGDEKKLMEAVATVGPVSVAIDASGESFQFYQTGIYYDSQCDPQELDHAVLVVGYGTDKTGNDYWLVKNSWGTTWGDEGYIKMIRNKDNNCGIASTASYPLV